MANKRKLAAIMFTDIAGYTAMMGKDEDRALKVLDRHRDILKPLLLKNNGEWLKEMGDGTISSFNSTHDAVNCAIEIQKALKNDPDLNLRIGIHIGDIVFSDGDVFGDGVNIASRIEPLSQPGGICITHQVYDTLTSKPDIEAIFLGEKNLKNVNRPIKVFALSGEGLSVPEVTEPESIEEHKTEEKPAPQVHKMPESNPSGLKKGLMIGSIPAIIIFFVFAFMQVFANKAEVAEEIGISSIAVLPFNISSGQTDISSFIDELPRNLVLNLQNIKPFKVISYSVVKLQYPDKTPPPKTVGIDLDVRSVVLGTIILRGTTLVINIEIVDTKDNSVILAERFSEELTASNEFIKNISFQLTDRLAFLLKRKMIVSGF